MLETQSVRAQKIDHLYHEEADAGAKGVVSCDKLVVTQTAQLTGSITVSAIGAINAADVKKAGQIQMMSWKKKTGAFDTENGIIAGAGAFFTLHLDAKGAFLVPK